MSKPSESDRIIFSSNEPFDVALFDSLIEQYRTEKMSVTDAIVCVGVYICWHDEVPLFYDEIVARLEGEKEPPMMVFGKWGEEDVKRALWHAKQRGFISFKLDGWGGDQEGSYYIPFVSVVLREDVFDALESTRLGLHAQFETTLKIT